ncbi:CBS domain-containing protein [Hyphomicrobium sp. ghe19]|uniref:CBS domain-containing protein n=1 Tax=Hyphomicrobium sp. ghe19 TaxID=2682968 RepID=UPI001366F191|nr:Hypoxic response protein 1 [Hyphomicrobium sp. ghe19]
MKVSNVLELKGANVMTVRPSDTIREVARRLLQEKVGALVVSSDGVALDGIISERDISSGFAVHGPDIVTLLASDLMTRGVITCGSADKISDVARVMTERRIRHVPVKDGTRIVGIISIGDILKHRLDEVMLETRVLRDIALSNR